MSRLRKRMIIPEDTHIRATLTDPKIAHGNFGRQVELNVNTLEVNSDDDVDYKGTTFKAWFSFGKDKDTKEEIIYYDSPLYQLLSFVRNDVEEVIGSDELAPKEYEKCLKNAVRDLDDLEIVARVGVKANKEDASKKKNILQPGTFGVYQDPDQDFENLDMGEKNENIKTPIDNV